MNIAVTGSEGFIGTRLVGILTSRNHRVLAIDNLSLGQDVRSRTDGYDFAAIDICDPEALYRAFEGFRPECIVHLAAIHHIPTCERDAPKALHVNIVGTQIVLETALRVGCKRIVFSSSGAVYDWCEGPLAPDKTPTNPRDVYSISKLTNEQQLMMWQRKTKGVVVIGRLFNTIGPNDRNGHLIPEILAQLRGNEQPRVVQLGNTGALRDYVYVDDTAEALSRMVDTQPESEVLILNVGTGSEHSVLEIVDQLATIVGSRYVVRTDASRLRATDRPSQRADIALTVRRLGWKPTYSLEQALRLTAGIA